MTKAIVVEQLGPPEVMQLVDFDPGAPVPKEVIAAASRLQGQNSGNPNSITQAAAIEALTGPQDHLPLWVAEFARRRVYAWKRLNCMPGLSCVNAKGAFYLFPNISQTGLGSLDFCSQLLDKQKVAAVPGTALIEIGVVIAACSTSMESIEKGLDRIESFLRGRA